MIIVFSAEPAATSCGFCRAPWAGPRGSTCPVVVLFDLGQEASLSSLLFNTTGGGNAGVHEAGIRVFVSLDDQSYVLAGDRPGLR